jgi:hypothetical protein
MQKLLRWFAFLSALLVCGALLVIPMGTYQSVTVDADGAVTRTSGRTTLVEGQGASAFIALSIPLLASLSVLLPWPARGRRAADVASAAIVTVFCILASLSVGPYFYPTALALITVAAWPRSRRPAT